MVNGLGLVVGKKTTLSSTDYADYMDYIKDFGSRLNREPVLFRNAFSMINGPRKRHRLFIRRLHRLHRFHEGFGFEAQ